MSDHKITLSLNEAQFAWLENARKTVVRATGVHVSIETIMFGLMEQGLPAVEQQLKLLGSNGTMPQRPKLTLVSKNDRV